jgi:hypothetical protein
MRSKLIPVVILCVTAITNIALTDTAGGINIDFVSIGNADNAADTRVMNDGTTGHGAVGYEYRIGKYEVTNAQWNAFTSAAGAPAGNPADAYDDSATYPGGQQPTNNISWYEALQFCNYLTSGDKSKGAYQFSGNNDNPGDFLGIDRAAAQATYGNIYLLPTEDEWYKAAYYKSDGSGYSIYSSGLDTKPVADEGWNYYGGEYTFPWDAGTGTKEQNGTFDMMGNVYEWNETLIGTFRGIRGGASNSSGDDIASWDRSALGEPFKEYGPVGFRIASIGEPPCILSDDFEDGVVNSNLWVTLGNKGGQGAFGTGGWQHSFTEYPNGNEDGYLKARVWGPPSGNTYWGEASVRTTYNFNDGNQWLINFTWETTAVNPYFDCFAIQITDGGFPQTESAHWLWNVPAGTVNLWFTVSNGEEDQPIAPFSKRTWSISIDPVGIASFYKSPNAEEAPHSQVVLDLSQEWYVRLVQVDATSAGFPGGDNTFKLYHFTAMAPVENEPPIADAGDDVVADANEVIILDGSASYDPNGEIIEYTWKRLPDDMVICSGKDPNCKTRALGRAEEVIELTVTDNCLATATDTVRIVSRATQDLEERVAAMQSQIEQLQQQIQELKAVVDKIVSLPPIRQLLEKGH